MSCAFSVYIKASDAFLLELFETAEVGSAEHEIYYSSMVGHDYKVGKRLQ